MHALSEEFDYAYVLFHDENKDKGITKSVHKKKEKKILKTVYQNFNVIVKFV